MEHEKRDQGYIHLYPITISRKKMRYAISAFFKTKRKDVIARYKKWQNYICRFRLPAGENKYFRAYIRIEKNELRIVAEVSRDIGMYKVIKITDLFAEQLMRTLRA